MWRLPNKVTVRLKQIHSMSFVLYLLNFKAVQANLLCYKMSVDDARDTLDLKQLGLVAPPNAAHRLYIPSVVHP